MEEFKRFKKKYNIITIILLVLASLSLGAGISVDILAEINHRVAIALFIAAIVWLVLTIPLLIVISRIQSKIIMNIVERLNKELNSQYEYKEAAPILDIVESSMHPYEKDMRAFSKDGIIGKYEDIDFEYYLCTLEQDSLFSKAKNTFELYVFKNVCVFPKCFFVTAKKLKHVEEYKITKTNGEASIYTTGAEEIILDDLPKNVLFLSLNHNTLYVYKAPQRKKALFQVAKDFDDFKRLFEKEIEKIPKTFEETKSWIG
ncbi:MAG: hypothetical protein NC310_05085 [Roseburia sp.]|nr:hypothetical protein [Anaeroplasma bactoclasticum]MCM1196433.1 hypothetical protein [Roseburia sp.]